MVTVLNIFALWFGLGGLFTAALLWVCIAARRSRDRAELPMSVSRIAAAAAGPNPHRGQNRNYAMIGQLTADQSARQEDMGYRS
jgi:hypothetical protein